MPTGTSQARSSSSTSNSAGELLRLHRITKRFPGVIAVNDVSIDVAHSEVHVLFGENGAGKSTLVNIVAGTYPPDSGTISLHGQEVRQRSPHYARELGISAVFQEFSLVPTLPVAANIYLGRERLRSRLLYDREMERAAARALDALGFSINPKARVDTLSRSEQQMVEIAKALEGKPSILILDEPTASLTQREGDMLFSVVDRLKGERLGVIYITHKIQEIRRVADRITVLRDGRLIATLDISEASDDRLVSLMTGRKFEQLYPTIKHEPGPVRLRLEGLTLESGRVQGASIEVRGGEIVGLAGLVGSGKSEIGRACFGLEHVREARIEIDGRHIARPTPRRMLAQGVVYTPSDRYVEGLVLPRPVRENVTLPALDLARLSRYVFVRRREETRVVSEISSRLNIRPPRIDRPVRFFSGGNQQKVMFARGLVRNSGIFIFDEPTTGIDVGARIEVYQLMKELCEAGAAILLISSDLPEVLHLSHRVYVVHQGRVRAELGYGQLTESAVLERFFKD